MTVGFTVRDIANPLFADIAKGAETTLRPEGYSMLLTNSDGDPELELSHLSLFRRRRVDGLILSLASEVYGPTLDLLGAIGRPMVLVDRDVPSLAAGSVLCDHYPGAVAAVSDLLSKGRNRIAFIAGDERLRATRERLKGYTEAHRAAGVDVDDDLIFQGTYTEAYGRSATETVLTSVEKPSAIFAGGVQLTIGSLSVLQERNITIGSDIGFVACDALPVMRLLAPGLSVVTRDSLEIGQKAAQELLRQLAGEDASVTTVSTEYFP